MTDQLAHPQRGDVPLRTDATFEIVRDMAADGHARYVQGRPVRATDGDGALAPGALGVLIDSALGNGVVDSLADDERIITSHMHIELIQRFTPQIDAVIGEGFPVAVGNGSAFARVEMRAPGGDLLATATGRFAMLPATSLGGGTIAVGDAGSAAVPARGEPHPLVAGAGVHDLLDTRVLELADGFVRVAVVAGHHLANERSGLHGGVGVLIGERTSELALRATLPASLPATTAMRPVELRIAFVRPIPAVGQLVECRAVVVNAGRTVSVTRAELFTSDGRLAVVVDGIHIAV
ncbi:MAG: hypothetical protein JWM12_241 [Ilumatobacteraceae bacterium]|nr:hypothetical protein [Ilumatobacteraceae bacterium]